MKETAVIRSVDMPEDIQNDALSIALRALSQTNNEKEVSITLKKVCNQLLSTMLTVSLGV